MSKVSVDTNILVYLHDEVDSAKREKAKEILSNLPTISAQVISEYLNVLRRLLKVHKLRLIEHAIVTIKDCEIISLNNNVLETAKNLIIRYDFQLFDSIVVAAALEANCSILYSEDLQHNQRIDNRLTIINPFLS